MRRTSKARRDFYRAVINQADRAELDAARQVEGLDEEIALLRLRLARQIAAEGVEKLPLRELELLVRALRARHHLSRQDERDLTDSLSALLENFAAALAGAGEG